MPFDYSRTMPYVIAVLAVLLVYRRLRRSFGRQPLRPLRMGIRIAILIVLGCTLLPVAVKSGQFLIADLAGILAGVGLGLWGARSTRYQQDAGGLYYIPHTYSGIAVSLLFVGRLVYRMVVLYSMNRSQQGAAPDVQAWDSSAMFQSPFTVGLLFVVIGYYVCYYGLVLWKAKHISPEDLEVISTPTTVSAADYGRSSSG